MRRKRPIRITARWQPELRQLADRLEESGGAGRPFGWFRTRIKGFADRNRNDALRVLTDIDQRLGLLEETSPRKTERKKPTPKTILKGCYSSRAPTVRS